MEEKNEKSFGTVELSLIGWRIWFPVFSLAMKACTTLDD